MNTSLFTSHGFELSPEEIGKFEQFLSLFIEYNTHTNLSAIRDAEGIIEKHFIDSLYGAGIIAHYESPITNHKNKTPPNLPFSGKEGNKRPQKLLDIGSGGGFPGIPLKIVMPALDVTLLDSVGKKVKAMNHFVEKLELDGIYAIQERAEILAKDQRHALQYDFVVSRATAYISDILTWSLPFLMPGGRILLYKMPSDEEKKDLMKIMKKLKLTLEGELEYTLGEKERVILVFSKI